MSGYHWSDDPVLVGRDRRARERRKELKTLHFDGWNETASCTDCGATVRVGELEAHENNLAMAHKHRNWHKRWNENYLTLYAKVQSLVGHHHVFGEVDRTTSDPRKDLT